MTQSTPVLSTRELENERVYAAELLKNVNVSKGVGLSPIESKAVLVAYITLCELAKEEVRTRRVLQAKFDRVTSCR